MKKGGRTPLSAPGGPMREGGFTLMEVMIAIAILAIALTAVYRSQSQSVSMAANARFLTTAALLGQGKMAEVDSRAGKDVSTENGDFGTDFPDYEWRLEVEDGELEYLKKVKLIVTNNKLTANNTYEIVLYKLAAN